MTGRRTLYAGLIPSNEEIQKTPAHIARGLCIQGVVGRLQLQLDIVGSGIVQVQFQA